MSRMAIMLSPELCIGCRGCQTACKSWNGLSGTKTKNTGSVQNPPDLISEQFNVIKYTEVPFDSGVRWLFTNRRCMHCGDAGCMKICPAPGALYRTPEGAVAFDQGKCIGCKLCVAGCPFDVPRYNEKDKVTKCHMCFDRIASGLKPACAKACPTGAIKFGDRKELISAARKIGYEKLYGEMDLDGTGTLYAFKDAPKIHGLDEKPAIPESVVFWHKVLKPLAYWGLGGAVVASLVHYVAFGPKKDEEVKS